MLSAPVLPALPARPTPDPTFTPYTPGTPGTSGTPYSTTPPRVRTPFPPRDRDKTMTPAPGPFSLAMYPDIADVILFSSSYSTQTTLRRVCAYFRNRIDIVHCTHISLRTAMCRSPLPSLHPSSKASSGLHLIASRPDRVVRRDADRIGYFVGNAVPGLGYGVAFGCGVLGPPERQRALLKYVRVLDIFPNDINWEFATPRAQLDVTISCLDPNLVHTLRFAEEIDPWWYTRTLSPQLVVFDLRHFDSTRPGKHSTHSYSLACPLIPTSATTVIIHIPISRWRFTSPPLNGFIAHEGTQRMVLLFHPRHSDIHRVEWDGIAPPLGVLHKLVQDNAAFPNLQLVVVGAEAVDPGVFGRALDGEGSVEQRLARSIKERMGWIKEGMGQGIKAMSVDEFRETLGQGEWETYTQFPHYDL